MSAVVMVLGMNARDRSRHASRLAATSGAVIVDATFAGRDVVASIGRALQVDRDLIIDVPATLEPMHAVAMAADAVHDGAAIECVVDAPTMLQLLGLRAERPCGCGRARRLVEQLEQSTIATVVEWQSLDTPTLSLLMAVIRHLAPRARLRLDRGVVEPSTVARIPREHDHAGWTCVLNGDHDPHMTDPSVSALRIEQLRPFQPDRLRAALETIGSGRHGIVVRSAGFAQLATRADRTAMWDHVAGSIDLHPLPTAVDDAEPLSFGQDLAFIGVDLDHDALTGILADAALDDAELALGAQGWTRFTDPFPAWPAD